MRGTQEFINAPALRIVHMLYESFTLLMFFSAPREALAAILISSSTLANVTDVAVFVSCGLMRVA